MSSRLNCELRELKLGDPVGWREPQHSPCKLLCSFIQPEPSGTAPAEGRSSGSGRRMDPVAHSDPSCLHLTAGLDSALSGYALACVNLARVPRSQDTYQRWEQKMSICANCEQVSGHLSIASIIQQPLVIWHFKSDLLASIRIETSK